MGRSADSSHASRGDARAADVAAGTIIAGRYRIERAVGTGGMATIWEGTHLVLNRSIAVKFIHIAGPASSKVRARFLREARVAAAVRHRNVVDIIDFGTEDGRPFMIMELLVGSTLARRLDQGPSMSVAEAVRIMARVLSGLAAVHDAGIVHRDLKPENVFLVEDADGIYPKLLDFGVSRSMDPDSELMSVFPTHENAIVGTPQYMSPEQARGLKEIDHRSDLWSAGIMLFELLSGVLPFDAEAVGDVIIQIATGTPPDFALLRPDLAGPVENVIKKAMQRRPEHRFQSAREMRSALLAAAAATAAAMQDSTLRGVSRSLDSVSDLPLVNAKELLDAVGEAYEPGDSGLLELIDDETPPSGPTKLAIPPPPPRRGRDVLTTQPKRSGTRWLVPLTILLLGLAGAAYWGFVLPGRGAHGPGPIVAQNEVAPLRAHGEVHVTLRGVPRGATVEVDGVRRDPPLSFPRSNRAHTIEVRGPDGHIFRTTHVATDDGSYDVVFGETAQQASRRPVLRARSRPRPSAEPQRPARDNGLLRDPGF
jgi:serine/threonine-protein kinase